VTATADLDPAPAATSEKSLLARQYDLHPSIRLSIRWAYIALLIGVAFRHSFVSLAETTRGGGLGGYVWAVFAAAILVAVGVARRHRTELPIHDRQTDVIVGTMGMIFALLLHAILLQRYALYFHLLRLDLVAMWAFAVSVGIALFGLRPVARYGWVWGMLLLVFPLPYYITVFALGGGKPNAGAAALMIAGVATGIAVGRTFRRGLIGSVISWAVGGFVLWIIVVFFYAAPLAVYQQVPALTAIVLVGGAFFLHARRGQPKALLGRKVEPLAAGQVWAAVPLVAVVAIALSFVQLPSTLGTTPMTRIDTPLDLQRPLSAPPGWHLTDTEEFNFVRRMYGQNSLLIRKEMTEDVGDPRYDRQSRPRTVMVDSITTNRPFTFRAYPTRVIYGINGARLSEQRAVDLGHGVTGGMLSGVDGNLMSSWNVLQFAWTEGVLAQQVTIWAVDNHDPGAPFPQPTGDWAATLGRLFTMLLRGNAAVTDVAPSFKDGELLTRFGTALVAARISGGGGP
jgi:hypothetical protein